MDPHTTFCPNPDCPARGQVAKGNITVHSRRERRYTCTVCEKTFAETTGTAFYRLRTARDVIVLVLTLLAYGCPVQAIVAAFGLDERTVVNWQQCAGDHCRGVHQQLVEQPGDLGQVQADDIRAKVQGGVLWLAMAIQVSTRLWLGGVLSAHRDVPLISALIRKVKAAALCRPLLFGTDGCRAYVRAIRAVFRELVNAGRGGRPRLRPWDNLCLGQVVKRHVKKQVVAVERRIVQGAEARIAGLLEQTQGGGQVNTAFIERFAQRATFRSRIAALVRRTRALSRPTETLHHATYLMGAVYNSCTYHQSLRVPLRLWPCRATGYDGCAARRPRHVPCLTGWRPALPVTSGRSRSSCRFGCHCHPGSLQSVVGDRRT